MNRPYLLLTALLCAALPGRAAALSADDFARGLEVTPDDALVQRLVVPEDVYRWTTRADLGDLRVLDPTGAPTPFAVRAPRPAAASVTWTPLPWFPLPAAAETADAAPSVNVQLGADGTVVAVRGVAAGAGGQGAHLLDATGLDQPLSALRLHWADDAADFMVRVRLEDSDNLNQWRTLIESTTLAQIGAGADRIVADRLDLSAPARRYLRLRLLDDGRLPALTGVDAATRLPGTPSRQHTRLAVRPAADRAAGTRHEYDSGGHFPVDQIRLLPPEPTYRGVVQVYSRGAPEASWRDHGRHSVYAFAANGAAAGDLPGAASDPIRVGPVTDRYWGVEWRSQEGIADPSRVDLELAWQPHEVVFLRQGSAAHLLVYGSAGLDPGTWPMAELSQRLAGASLDGLTPRPLGAAQTLGGAARLVAPADPRDWTTLVLWTVLVAGVLLVATLAYRVLR